MAACSDHGHAHGHAHDHGPSTAVQLEESFEGQGAPGSDLSALAAALPSSGPADADLDVQFNRAELLFYHIDEGISMHCEEHDVPKHATQSLAGFLTCARKVRQLSLFSDNEHVDDVQTGHLKFLLLDYYIAVLIHKYSKGAPAGTACSPSIRTGLVREARVSFEAFLERIAALDVIGPAERDALGISAALSASDRERGVGREENEGRLVRATHAGAHPSVAASSQRGSKIERFKRNLAAKKRLAELTQQRAREAALLARAGGSGLLSDGVGGDVSHLGMAGEESSRREQALLSVQIAARATVDDLEAIRQEEGILAHALVLQSRETGGDEAGPGQGQGQGRYTSALLDDRLDPRARARAAGPPPGDLSIDPARPGLTVAHIDPTFTVTKEVIKAAVWNNPHRPPTMDLEEWGEHVKGMTKEREQVEKE